MKDYYMYPWKKMAYKIKIITKESREEEIHYFNKTDNASRFINLYDVVQTDIIENIKRFENKKYILISEEIKFEDE